MYTLLIDTHSNKINIVLFENEKILVKKELETEKNHSITTMPVLIEVLKNGNIEISNINEIIVINGPGSFTGIRSGVTIAKTLAYTLNIPIKVMSSLLIKAVSFPHEEINIVEREKNGVFLGKFDKENQLQGDYKYVSNKEYKELEKNNTKEDIAIDYMKIFEFAKKMKSTNPHAVNPLYVKKIEVQK